METTANPTQAAGAPALAEAAAFLAKAQGGGCPTWQNVLALETGLAAALGAAGSVLAGILARAGQAAACGNTQALEEKAALLSGAAELAEAGRADESALLGLLAAWHHRRAAAAAAREAAQLVAPAAENPYARVLQSATGEDVAWMDRYGLPLLNEEKELARWFFAQPHDELRRMAKHITEAMLHGFISQNREIRGRRLVRLFYCAGQEALAREVVAELAARGFEAVVMPPACLVFSGAWARRHAFDAAAPLSEETAGALLEAYRQACAARAAQLRDCCGLIGIGQFGNEPPALAQTPGGAYLPNDARRGEWQRLAAEKRAVDEQYLPRDDFSYTRVVFPNRFTPGHFESVMADFWHINLEDSAPFEHIQQTIIDALDACTAVHIKGKAGNETDLTIRLQPLQNPEQHSNFLNCGGDLNIPYGELFTTPQLAGTEGVYHVPEAFLNGVCFRGLRLVFHNGAVTDTTCANLPDAAEARAFVQNHLFGMRNSLPVGEFAIGSNTRAARAVRRHGLEACIPLLVAEKTGPHIALGDPCFARAESAPVYNLPGGKEVTARSNERTRSTEEGAGRYTGLHTDITLPFGEIESLAGILPGGERVAILQSGRFVLPGCEALNENLA